MYGWHDYDDTSHKESKPDIRLANRSRQEVPQDTAFSRHSLESPSVLRHGTSAAPMEISAQARLSMRKTTGDLATTPGPSNKSNVLLLVTLAML